MANREGAGVQLGITGNAVAENVMRARKSAGLSLRDLEELLSLAAHGISLSGLSKIENGGRRVDVDDLIALAIALKVSPLALLLPQTERPYSDAAVTGATAKARVLWQWAVGEAPLDGIDARTFQSRSLPWWFNVLSDVPADSPPIGSGGVLFRLGDSARAVDPFHIHPSDSPPAKFRGLDKLLRDERDDDV